LKESFSFFSHFQQTGGHTENATWDMMPQVPMFWWNLPPPLSWHPVHIAENGIMKSLLL
jgi:hypothetical protein